MKADIHPAYSPITITCTCGAVHQTSSTLCKNIHVDVCNKCHPFFTGQQKVVDTGGRIDKFKKRFGGLARAK
jgi:large subunit ribosomal protein L31